MCHQRSSNCTRSSPGVQYDVVSFRAVFWDVTQCSPQRNGFSHPNNIPFFEISQSWLPFHFREHFCSKFARWNLPNQRRLFIFVSHNRRHHKWTCVSGICLLMPKNTGDVWMSFVCLFFTSFYYTYTSQPNITIRKR